MKIIFATGGELRGIPLSERGRIFNIHLPLNRVIYIITIGAKLDTRPHLPHTDLRHVTSSSTPQGLVILIKPVLNVNYASNWILISSKIED